MKSITWMAIALCSGMLLAFATGIFIAQYNLPNQPNTLAKEKVVAPQVSTPKHSSYFYHKQSFFQQHGRRHYDIVCIGDSLIDATNWQELFPTLHIANRGIYGDSTFGVLQRLNSIDSTFASKAFIMLGTHDFYMQKTVEGTFHQYIQIVQHLLNQGMEVYIQSTLFRAQHHISINKKTTLLNARLQQFSQHTLGVTYIDLNTTLAPHGYLAPAYSQDGLHLNGDGYAIWKKHLMPWVYDLHQR